MHTENLFRLQFRRHCDCFHLPGCLYADNDSLIAIPDIKYSDAKSNLPRVHIPASNLSIEADRTAQNTKSVDKGNEFNQNDIGQNPYLIQSC